VNISRLSREQLPRASQLTQRTNQFNLTTRRRSETGIEELLQSSNIRCLTVDVKDRFGDYGLVGLMIVRLSPNALEVDTFLLSCRSLGRGVEHRMLAALGELAGKEGHSRVDVHLLPTKKNRPALEFLETVGNRFVSETEAGYVYRFPADYAASVKPNKPRVNSGATESSSTNQKEMAGSDPSGTSMKSFIFQRICSELYSAERVLDAVSALNRRRRDARTLNLPEGETQSRLARIWEEILGIEPIGIYDNFFDLGGTSLQAVQALAEIERAFGVSLSTGALFEAATIEQLGRLIDSGDSGRRSGSLVAIQPRGSRTPLFCVHAAGGNVLFYRDLANRLGLEQPLYGLQLLGLGEGGPVHSTVEEMALHYIDEIRRVQSRGPYLVAGACFGGFVAFEMARQLRNSGEEVALVALFDTNGPNYPRLRPITRLLRLERPLIVIRRIQHHWRSLSMLDPMERRAYLRDKIGKTRKGLMRVLLRSRNRFNRKVREITIGARPKSLKVHDVIRNAQARYRPKAYPGKITVFRGSEQPLGTYPEPTMGWGVMAEEVEVQEAPGFHAAIISEPRVRVTADLLKKCLAAATEGDSEVSSDSATASTFAESSRAAAARF
jgi:thioesterase domain-containing protein/acyl carrier protein